MKILRRGLTTAIVLLSMIFSTTIALAGTNFNQTIEGYSNYFVTGESFANNIQLAGYSARDQKFYTNLTAETTKTVAPTSVATFNYEIIVFDGTGTQLGNLGTYQTPQNIAAAAGATTVQVNDKVITLSSPLTTAFRETINIISVTIAP